MSSFFGKREFEYGFVNDNYVINVVKIDVMIICVVNFGLVEKLFSRFSKMLKVKVFFCYVVVNVNNLFFVCGWKINIGIRNVDV